MGNWIKIKLNANQIEETSSATSSLIKIPSKDIKVWVSNKCIRRLTDWYSCVSINESFTYYTNKKNKIDGFEIIDYFENQIMNDKFEKNIPEKKIIEQEKALESLSE